MTYSKKEAARLLGVSTRTLQRRMHDGSVRFTKRGTGRFAEARFSAEELRRCGATIPEPTSPEPETAPAPEQSHEPSDIASVPHRMNGIETTRESDDLAFAAKYLAGEACDSCGNFFNGSNPRFQSSGPQTLLGPLPPRVKTRPGTADHMDQNLLGTSTVMHGTDGEIVPCANADNHPLLPGFKPLPTATKLPHPNQSRQDVLDAILSGVRAGWSR